MAKNNPTPSKWEASDVTRLLANPFYCINISPSMAVSHPILISEDMWISTAEKLIERAGARAFLIHLLENLKGNYIREEEISAEDIGKEQL
jgi:hypothetical protein